MISTCTPRFWELLGKLPPAVQSLAEKNYQLWRTDPLHPSLRYRQLKGSANRMTVRVGEHHRALGVRTGTQIIWVWIGTHAEYDRLIS